MRIETLREENSPGTKNIGQQRLVEKTKIYLLTLSDRTCTY